jgi:hypothetical protein
MHIKKITSDLGGSTSRSNVSNKDLLEFGRFNEVTNEKGIRESFDKAKFMSKFKKVKKFKNFGLRHGGPSGLLRNFY